MFDANLWRTICARPRFLLAATLLAGLTLVLLPRRAVEPLRSAYDGALEPGRAGARYLCDWGASAVARCKQSAATAEQLAQLTADLRRLQERNHELETALLLAAAAPGNDHTALAGIAAPDLLRTDAVRARVLGRRACAVLANAEIIDLGRSGGALAEALILTDSQVTIDQGRDALVDPGDVALAGRHVYGKIVDVGPHTAMVRRADEPGYRDVVQLAGVVAGALRLGPQGVLEGTGTGHCRVRLVSADQPVEPGQLVLTAHEQGLASQPLLYGTVARAERPAGASHWEITVDLSAIAAASPNAVPAHLVVLRAQLNPARVATRGGDERDAR